jgi:hypothetical protein
MVRSISCAVMPQVLALVKQKSAFKIAKKEGGGFYPASPLIFQALQPYTMCNPPLICRVWPVM